MKLNQQYEVERLEKELLMEQCRRASEEFAQVNEQCKHLQMELRQLTDDLARSVTESAALKQKVLSEEYALERKLGVKVKSLDDFSDNKMDNLINLIHGQTRSICRNVLDKKQDARSEDAKGKQQNSIQRIKDLADFNKSCGFSPLGDEMLADNLPRSVCGALASL